MMRDSVFLTSCKRKAFNNRRAETLVEILAAITVLSIGLVGVLAAIPFGGFRMSQMSEADNSAAVGRNAVRLMRTHGWCNPNNWRLNDLSVGISGGRNLPVVTYDSNEYKLDLTYPFFIDPRDSSRDSYGNPSALHFYPVNANSEVKGKELVLPYVSPLGDNGQMLGSSVFFQVDDFTSGSEVADANDSYRPRLEMEYGNTSFTQIPTYNGRYSWMATVRLKSSREQDLTQTYVSDVVSADYDAVVFRDRIAGDQRAIAAKLATAGYQGGTIELNLTTMVGEGGSDDDYARLREQLAQTRYIMIAGNDDYRDSGTYVFARWYKIANWANIDETTIRLDVIGPNMPENWMPKEHENWEGMDYRLTALFYPGVIGVYSGSVAF